MANATITGKIWNGYVDGAIDQISRRVTVVSENRDQTGALRGYNVKVDEAFTWEYPGGSYEMTTDEFFAPAEAVTLD